MAHSRRHVTAALAASSALACASCSPAGVLNALAPSRLVAAGVPFGPEAGQRLDIHAPPHATAAPLIVFLYGGNWDAGSRQMYRFVGAALASRGVIAVIPDYRLYPAVSYPAFLEDCAAATAWTVRRADRLGADPSRLFLMGHSAGAYNAAMLSLDRRWLGAHGIEPARHLRGTIGLSGPYDFLPLTDPELIAIFGGADRADTQPIAYADGHGPPMLLATGAADTTVQPGNSVRLAQRIAARGGSATLRVYPGADHVDTIAAFAGPLHALAPTLRDTRAFAGVSAPV